MSPNVSAKSSTSDGVDDADAGRDACLDTCLEVPALATLHTALRGLFLAPPFRVRVVSNCLPGKEHLV